MNCQDSTAKSDAKTPLAFALMLIAAGFVTSCAKGDKPTNAAAPDSSLSTSAGSLKSATAPRITPANGTFRDLSTDHVRSDGFGTYVDGVAKVTSHFDSGGDYDLNLNGGQRQLTVTAPASGSGCALP